MSILETRLEILAPQMPPKTLAQGGGFLPTSLLAFAL